jgi:hypothetical protein
MDDFDAVNNSLIDAAPRLAFEHDHDRRVEAAVRRRLPDLFDEAARRPGTIAPPACRPRRDDVGSVNEEHAGSLPVVREIATTAGLGL